MPVKSFLHIMKSMEKIELTENMHRYFQIIDDNGEYISKSGNVYSFAKNLNIWKELSRYQFEDGMSVKQIKENVEAGEKGYFYFSYKGEGRYVTYEPLGINNWYVFSVMVEDFFGDSVKKVEHVFARLLLGLSICIVFVMGIIGLFLYRTMRMIREQNQKLFKGEKLDPLIIEMKINQKWNWYRIHTFLVDQNYMVGFFEDYNEIVSQGHIMGDQVLHEAGALLKAITRKEDVCGRLGGDEFVLYIQNASDMKAIIKCAEKINAALSMTYGGEEKKVTVTASIGVAVTRNDSDFRELYERADRALYQVKEEKKNGYMIKE